jgi:TolB protein
VAFEQPCVSPDGSKVAVVICAYDKTTSTPTPKLLIVTPNQPGSNLLHANVAKGEIYEPSWTPDGNGLVFAMHEGSNRNLYSVNVDGSNLKCLTPKGGNYGYPVYSPQKAK